MFRKPILVLFLALNLSAFPTSAGDDDHAARMTKAQNLMKVLDADKYGERLLVNLLAQIGQRASQVNPGRDDDIKALIEEHYFPVIRAAVPELNRQMAELYAASFTVAEMGQIIEFYRTPVGIKLVEAQVNLTQQMWDIGQTWTQGISKQADARFVNGLKQRGMKAPDKL